MKYNARKSWHFSKYHRNKIALLSLGKKKVKKILLYTDSRGDNLPRYNFYQHYGERLSQVFWIEAYLCPEKWTTILDFLNLYRSINSNYYDYIILHAGAVDAAPRQKKIFQEIIYPQKKEIFDRIFGESNMKEHLKTDLKCEYEGDRTMNMYSLDMALKYLIPLLKQIPSLIWINSNQIVPNWRGNYWRERPANISLIEEYSETFTSNLDRVVDLQKWSACDVKSYTFDNIHPNEEGSNYIFNQLLEVVN